MSQTAETSGLIDLWPDGPPDPIAGVGPEASFRSPAAVGSETDWWRNVTRPTLAVVAPAAGEANGGGVIICPGGGWRILAWSHEGMDLARWFAQRGVTAFVLKYRLMPTPDDPEAFAKVNAAAQGREAQASRVSGKDAPRVLADLVPDPRFVAARAAAANDGRRALALVRQRAGELGLQPDRIGMVGFSAGAFLTADVALAPGGAPLAYAATIYGGEPGVKPVPEDAPPLFACIAQDDRMLFRVVEGLYSAWSDADRPAELHVFQKGGHGFGMHAQGRPVDRWIELLEAWLKDLGQM